ncbi:MAG: 2-C-methyl-D-erythritol 4-phosphate cytidylyltransferase [Deltaproteobacteria bacterium RBG_16_47_11]|nr:MAG: 2-C-methyl-D-erythritol 4-phosphate cytidylyltransferase [Deltaproteobacteria bacterium RBG_16_47_11]
MMKADAVIVSAGKGHRFMEGRKKQFHLLAGKPILAHTLDKFETCPLIQSILLVVGEEDMDHCLKEIVEKYRYKKISQIIPGGKQRQESVKNGIDALSKDVKIVVIHDGVRPFVTKAMIEESIHSAIRFGAVVVAMPVKETIKMAHSDGTVVKTLDRESLWQTQTPQTFQTHLIKEAFHKAIEDGFIGTDDASLVERLGVKVHILPGSYTNIKITTTEDLMLAYLLIETQTHTGPDQTDHRGDR